MKIDLRGIYAITDSQLLSDESLLPAVDAAIRGGARVVQYRDKSSNDELRHRQASVLNRLCQNNGIPLIVNDDIELAADVGAAGVHIGQDDASYQQARATLGGDAIIGVSCYNSLELALSAQQAGADYIAFGRFFPSSIKPLAVQATTELLDSAQGKIHVPIVAIGGINAQNGGILIQHGAAMLAVISALFADPDPERATNQLSQLFN